MRALWRRFKNGYLNLRLQTKFTIALISIVVLPAFLTVFLFYGKLYNMVVSNTIRQEQDASAKTAQGRRDEQGGRVAAPLRFRDPRIVHDNIFKDR